MKNKSQIIILTLKVIHIQKKETMRSISIVESVNYWTPIRGKLYFTT